MIDLPEVLQTAYPKGIVKGPDKSHRISPSRLLNCMRGAFMKSLGYDRQNDSISEQNLSYGTMRHSALQKRLLDLGMLLNPDGSLADGDEYHEEMLQMDDPPFLGYMDGRLKADNSSGAAVLEIKTIGKKLSAILTPQYNHYDQALLYMYVTGLPEAYILYESKLEKSPSVPWKQFVVPYDEERANALIKRGRDLLKALETRKIPLPDKDCYCRMPEVCFNKKIQQEEELGGFII